MREQYFGAPVEFRYTGKEYFPFDLQRFAEEGVPGENGVKTGEGLNNPVNIPPAKMVEKTDPVTGKTYKIPAELDIYLGHVISRTREETDKKYKPIVEKIEAEKSEMTEIRAEYEKLKEANLTAEQRADANAKKAIEKHEVAAKLSRDEAIMWKTRFEETSIKNEIFASFGGEKLCNPEQTAMCLEREGSARMEEKVDANGKPIGKFETRLTLTIENEKGEFETVDGTPAELFKKWVKQDKNLHHLRNDMPPGGGTKSGTHKGGKKDFSGLSPVERINAARESKN